MLQELIETYGYFTVLIGAFLEGETILVLAGFAAERGYLLLPWVMIVAAFGGFIGDQFYFFVGRRYGNRILEKYPDLKQRAVKVDEWLHRFHAPLIIGIRFMYGFRIIGPVIIGMGRVSAPKFMILNFIGACLWSALVASIGYLFAEAIHVVLADAKRYEHYGFAAILLIAFGAWVFHRVRAKKNKPA